MPGPIRTSETRPTSRTKPNVTKSPTRIASVTIPRRTRTYLALRRKSAGNSIARCLTTAYPSDTGMAKSATIANANPVILDSAGRPNSGAIYLDPSLSYKMVLSPSTDTDPPTNAIKTQDNYYIATGGYLRQVDQPPAYAVGDRVRARDVHPVGHTRLPRYVRGRTGIVQQVLPAQVFPDTAAHFVAENPQHVYQVAFPSRQLWGDAAEDFELTIDLFESYLEPAS